MNETETLKRFRALKQMVDCGAWDVLKSEIEVWISDEREFIFNVMATKPEQLASRTNIGKAGKMKAWQGVIDFVETEMKHGNTLIERMAKRDNQ